MIVMRRISLSLGIAATALMLCVTPAHADESAEIDKLLRQGQTAQALQRANQWLTQHPKDLKVRFRRGVILADQGRLNEAIVQFAELSRDHPNLAEARNNLAVLYAARGEFDKAQRELEQTIASHPPCKLRGFDEFLPVVSSAWKHSKNVLSSYDGHSVRLCCAIQCA